MKRNSWKGLFTAGVVATSLLASTTLSAAVDMFLTMDGIVGESQDDKHKGAIDVLAWSWGESAGGAQTSRGKLSRACIQDLSLTKYIDSATPALIMNGVSGQVVPKAVLVVRKAGDRPVEYLQITMHNVTVSSFSTGGSGGEDRLTENVVLHFESMKGQYVKQKPDGSAGEAIEWDIDHVNSAGCQ